MLMAAAGLADPTPPLKIQTAQAPAAPAPAAAAPAKPTKCKDAKGKFAKCGTPGAKPVA